MGTLKEVTQQLKYKVPAGHYCNLISPYTLHHVKEKCRFCVGNNKEGWTCLIYNMVLSTEDGNLVVKTEPCGTSHKSHLLRSKATVIEIPDQALSNNEPMVDVKKIMKLTIDDFLKIKKQLESQGFPSAMAEKLAKELVLKG